MNDQKPIYFNGMAIGLTYLLLNLLISVSAQLLLKAGMLDLGSFQVSGDSIEYFFAMVNWKIIGGLVFYATGIIFWLLCLSKLELSFAYPVATLQYVLIFFAAWYFFEEDISIERIAGMVVIAIGVIIISLEMKNR